jgi:hypothetical protein
MATAAPNPNENGPSRMRNILKYSMNEDIRSRLPQENSGFPPSEPPLYPPSYNVQGPQPSGSGRPWWNTGFFPLFWTIASALSLAVNVVLCLAVLGLLAMRGPIVNTVTGQSTGILGGLYSNFQAMDKATIRTTIPVDGNIPVTIDNIVVPVRTDTTILVQPGQTACLSKIRIVTGGLSLNAPGCITFGQETALAVKLNMDIPLAPIVRTIPVHLDVPVNIPLRDTELHQPFVGLQEVVRPWYCLFLPKTDTLYMQNCANTPSPISTGSFTP